MDESLVLVERRGAVAQVTLNRPAKLNVLNTALIVEATHAIAGVELLAGNLLGAGHEALGPVDLHDERATLVAVRGAGDDLALTLGEVVQQAGAFILAEALDHHLLGGLGGNAAQRFQRNVLT